MQTETESARVAPVFEDLTGNPKRRKKIQLRMRQWQRLTAISKAEGRGLSQVIEHFLSWAEEDWRKITRPHKLESYADFLRAIEQSGDSGGDDEEEDEAPNFTPPPVAPRKSNPRK